MQLTLALVVLCGCATTQQRNIVLFVEGDVLRPGQYMLPAESTVGTLLDKAGGFTGRGGISAGDGILPMMMMIFRGSKKLEYRLETTPDWRLIPLEAGDGVSFPMVIF